MKEGIPARPPSMKSSGLLATCGSTWQGQDQDHHAGEHDRVLHPGVDGLASRVGVGGLVDLGGQGGGL